MDPDVRDFWTDFIEKPELIFINALIDSLGLNIDCKLNKVSKFKTEGLQNIIRIYYQKIYNIEKSLIYRSPDREDRKLQVHDMINKVYILREKIYDFAKLYNFSADSYTADEKSISSPIDREFDCVEDFNTNVTNGYNYVIVHIDNVKDGYKPKNTNKEYLSLKDTDRIDEPKDTDKEGKKPKDTDKEGNKHKDTGNEYSSPKYTSSEGLLHPKDTKIKDKPIYNYNGGCKPKRVVKKGRGISNYTRKRGTSKCINKGGKPKDIEKEGRSKGTFKKKLIQKYRTERHCTPIMYY